MRSTLVAALVACADSPRKTQARRFLLGLSSDELQFIAEFLGASILESPGECAASRAQLARRIARFQQARAGHARCCWEDQQHKMILLLEYLSRSAATARSRRQSSAAPA